MMRLALLLAIVPFTTSQPFDIESFGAVPGQDTHAAALLNGQALESALIAANASTTRPRTVLVRPGAVYAFLPHSSTIYGLSGVTLEIEGTLNLYSQDFASNTSGAGYPGWPNPYAALSFTQCSSVTITSTTRKGVVNGRGNLWWWYTILVADHRNNLLNTNGCDNLTLSGLTFLNAPQYNVLLSDTTGADIFQVTVRVDIEDQLDIYRYIGGGPPRSSTLPTATTPREELALVLQHAGKIGPASESQARELVERTQGGLMERRRALSFPKEVIGAPFYNPQWAITPPIPMVYALNTDGLDFTGVNIRVRNCTITNFDDSVCVKPSPSCTTNISIEDIRVFYGVGVSMGSVTPEPTGSCISNVTAMGLVFESPLKAMYIKPNPPSTAPGAHGQITGIHYRNVVVKDALWWAVYVGTQQQHQPGAGTNTHCPFVFPLFNSSCPTDPQITLGDITLTNISLFGGLFSPGVIIANASNPGKGFVWDGVVAHTASTWPLGTQYWLTESVEGVARGGTFPIPPGFTPGGV